MLTFDGEPISVIAIILTILGTALLWLVELKLLWIFGSWLFGSEMGAATTTLCFFVAASSNNSFRVR